MGKVLITGGSGFLMRNLRELYPHHDYYFPTSSQVNWETGYGVESLPDDFDVVIHSAAVMGGFEFIVNHPDRMLIENIRMTANFFEYILKAKPRKVITMGSGCTYPGYTSELLSENLLGCGRMHQSVELYGLNKMMLFAGSEHLLDNWDHFVLANMYGRYDHTDVKRSHVTAALLVKFILAQREGKDVQLLGTGSAQRDIMYVGDVCQAINCSIETEKGVCKAMNISTGEGTSIKTLADTIAKCLDFKGNILWGDESQDGALYKVMNNSLLMQNFDINVTPLEDGLMQTIPWFKENC